MYATVISSNFFISRIATSSFELSKELKKVMLCYALFFGREGVLPSYESSIWVTGMIEHRSNIVETDSVDNSL